MTDATLVKAVSSSTFVMLAGITLPCCNQLVWRTELLAKNRISREQADPDIPNHHICCGLCHRCRSWRDTGIGNIPGLAVSIAVQVVDNQLCWQLSVCVPAVAV